ncbi:uncharacterized protein LOC142356085 [Convolutriloba macropyga]|uniref:uncharacterized protein LOC142356085 n=1 Tax=Convolutriloba macropyga TaxID=536237 RepID=UPI003F51BBFC
MNDLFEPLRRQVRKNVSFLSNFPLLENQFETYVSYGDPTVLAMQKYRSSLRLHLAQYNDPGYEDTMMEFFQWDQLLGIVSSDVDAIVKVCQWKDRSCLQSSTGGRWVALYTRVGQCWELDVPDREVWLTSQTMRLVFDFEVDQGMPVFQIGGGLNFKVYLYDPTVTSMTTWDKSYSFDIGPGFSYKLGLSIRKFKDQSGFSDCIEEGKMK